MDEQVPISSDAIADTGKEEGVREVTPDVGYQRHAVVNNVYVGTPGDSSGGWVLVDTGVIGSTGRIESTAGKRFGKDIPPVAIILTHGHSDHSGTVEALAEKWDVPIYAHTLELPLSRRPRFVSASRYKSRRRDYAETLSDVRYRAN